MLEAARLWTLAVPAVSAFVASLVRDFQARDDVLQDVAAAVIESFAGYDRTRPFVPWTLGIARNMVRLYFRRQAHERIVFDSEAVDALAAAFADASADPDRSLDRLGECVGELDQKSRELCRLRYELDLKPAAIGQAVSMGANTVAKTLQRIRERLRECVERKARGPGAGS